MDLNRAVAVVGLGCRYPGGDGLEDFWKMLMEGKSQMKLIPEERFSVDAFVDSNRDAPGKSYAGHAGLIDEHDMFDSVLFDIPEDEAMKMDLQQKLALETTYRALENAGFTADHMKGTDTSVFVGVMNDDYKVQAFTELKSIDHYSGTGTGASLIANRMSYIFDLRGPSLSLDTACSSGLVAIDRGAKSILNGESKMSIAGGVNIILEPAMYVALSKARMVSEKGQCHSFSALADGYARAEGCGMVVLKDLKQALEDKDQIWGYLLTDTNQDGQTVRPVTAPSQEQQMNLMKKIYKANNINVENIDMVEAHGTGTFAGDPVESGAIGNVIGKPKKSSGKMTYLGSVKSNIGHTESAAGPAGLIKALLSLKNNKIPASLHCKNQLNEKIDFEGFCLTVPTEAVQWNPKEKEPRLAVVNSFGFGGTNAHAVVQDHLIKEKFEVTGKEGKYYVTMSTKDETSCINTMKHLSTQLQEEPDFTLHELAFTSVFRRQHFPYRQAFHVKDLDDLRLQIETRVQEPEVKPIENLHHIWVFCGMGTQWPGMGVELMKEEPVFKKSLEKIDDIFVPLSGWSVVDALLKEEDNSSPEVVQPIHFAYQVALAELLKSKGLMPDVIIGHSVGEVAAAHVGGKLSLKDAVKLIYTRGKALSQVTGGSMLVVGKYPVKKTLSETEGMEKRVKVAAFNDDNSCTLSGDTDAIEELIEVMTEKKDGRFIKKLDVQAAFHSHHMLTIKDKFVQDIAGILALESPPTTTVYSTVTGKKAISDDFTQPEYWGENLCKPVLFSETLKKAFQPDAHNVCTEIGPIPALKHHIEAITEAEKANLTHLPSIKKKQEMSTLADSLCRLYELGAELNWKEMMDSTQVTPISLPQYQFNRKKLMFDPEQAKMYRAGKDINSSSFHPFIESTVSPNRARCVISTATMPFVYDHFHKKNIILPGTTYVEILFGTFYLLQDVYQEPEKVRMNVEFKAQCYIPNKKAPKELEVTMTTHEDGSTMLFEVRDNNTVCGGGKLIRSDTNQDCSKFLDVARCHYRCPVIVTKEDVFGALESYGFSYGPLLTLGLGEIVRNDTECLASLHIPENLYPDGKHMVIHPGILDRIMQLLVLFSSSNSRIFPIQIQSLVVRARWTSKIKMYVKLLELTDTHSIYNAALLKEDGEVIVEMKRIICKVLPVGKSMDNDLTACMYQAEWTPILPKGGDTADTEELPSSDTDNMTQVLVMSKEEHPILQAIKGRKDIHVTPLFRANLYVWKFDDNEIAIWAKENGVTNEKYSSIIWCPQAFDDNSYDAKEDTMITAKEMQDTTMDLSETAIFLIKLSENTKITLRIFTEGCWNMEGSIQDKSPVFLRNGMILSGIWGIIRCYLAEGVKQLIQMVDVWDMTTFSEKLGDIIDPANEELEVRVHDRKLSWVKMKPLPPDPIGLELLKKMKIHNGHNFIIQSSDVHATDGLHVKPTTQNNRLEDTKMTIAVEKAYMPNATLYPRTVEGQTDPNISNEIENEHYCKVLGTDFIGKIVQLPGTDKKSEYNIGDQVEVCHPTELSSSIQVNPAYVVPSDGDSNGPPLSWWILAWNLLAKNNETMKVGQKCLIIDDPKEGTPFGKFIRRVGKLVGYRFIEFEKMVPTGVVLEDIAFAFVLPSGKPEILMYNQDLPSSLKVSILRGPLHCHGYEACLQKFEKVHLLETTVLLKPSKIQEILSIVDPWRKHLEQQNGMKQTDFTEEVVFEPMKTEATVWDKSITKATHVEDGKIQYVPIHSEMQAYASKSELFAKDGCYVIVGGAKGIGMPLIEYMSANGAGFLLCISRSIPSEKIQSKLREIEMQHNSEITCVPCDITSYEALEGVLKNYLKPAIHIRGIFNGAAVLGDAFLERLTRKEFESALFPKIIGSWNLHLLSIKMSMPLDYFVFHSSMAAVFGNPGQSSYAAANCFGDNLTSYRRAMGLPGQTLNWGPMNFGILIESKNAKSQLTRQGLHVMENEEVQEMFERALLHDYQQITIVKVDMVKWWEEVLVHQPHVGKKVRDEISALDQETAEPTEDIYQQIVASSGVEEAKSLIKQHIGDLVFRVAAVRPTPELLEKGLVYMCDSLQRMELQRRISFAFQMEISAENIADPNTTILSLAEEISQELKGGIV